MTDNEKAATFIGWKWHAHRRDGGCIRQDFSVGCDLPDMSDPRNYMKALVSCAKLEPTLYCHLGAWSVDINLWRQTPAEAIVAFLAALYDADAKAHGLAGD